MARFQFVEWLLIWLLETSSFDFEWDDGNRTKSYKKHGVDPEEVEEIFHSHTALPLGVQIQPIADEERLGVVGTTLQGRTLFAVFVLREGKIRPISARPAHRNERRQYESLLRKISQGV